MKYVVCIYEVDILNKCKSNFPSLLGILSPTYTNTMFASRVKQFILVVKNAIKTFIKLLVCDMSFKLVLYSQLWWGKSILKINLPYDIEHSYQQLIIFLK